jgi:hypothetical protein
MSVLLCLCMLLVVINVDLNFVPMHEGAKVSIYSHIVFLATLLYCVANSIQRRYLLKNEFLIKGDILEYLEQAWTDLP